MLDPERTIAIVCGAKEWPNLANFAAADAFANTAELIRDYLVKEENLGLSEENVLWLFGHPGSVAQFDLIAEFLDHRFSALNAAHGRGVLILFFYVGHGAFFGASRAYCLLVQDTRPLIEVETSLPVASLARLFRLKATESQRILFLDCCFAGEAAKLFQGSLDQAVSAKALEVVEEDLADRGVALLCAASSRNPTKMVSTTSYTFFGHELMRVLAVGDSDTPGALTLRRVCQLVRRELRKAAGEDAPNPEVHVPDQERGDLAAAPLFPNPANASERRPHSLEEKTLGAARGEPEAIDGRADEAGESDWPAEPGATSDCLVVDLAVSGLLSVSTWQDGQAVAVTDPTDFAWPLVEDSREELRWYLEDYLQAPFGVYRDRGSQTAATLQAWGHSLFSAVFGSDAAREAYRRMRARRVPFHLVIRSASPQFLALPWEIVCDPTRSTPLALELAGMSRSLLLAPKAETFPVPGGRMRVLMVISRPEGTSDVGYRIIARPLLERLDAVRGNVDLVVLRPPTLDALSRVLTEAGRAGKPFQVVHFDGHGASPSDGDAGYVSGLGSEGVLAFERDGGGVDLVPASRVAQVLNSARVPVVVMNACQSATVNDDIGTSIAVQLLAGGAASVVAMAYTVYATAGAEFMTAFYERLFAGDAVSLAVTAGRQRLFQRNLRPSPVGDLPLADWLVPVLYLGSDVSFPQARTSRSGELPSLNEMLDRLAMPDIDGQTDAEDLDPADSFVGRDDLLYELEVAVHRQKVILLHGLVGSGKTEAAKAFGRWWRDTGGVARPEWIFWYSFNSATAASGLDGVLAAIGQRIYGTEFARLGSQERYAVMRETLDRHQMLLVWDNFQCLRSMPDPTPEHEQLGEVGCRKLREFLFRLSGKQHGSSVVITSRSSESWLGDVRRIRVEGLRPDEAAEYARDLLAPYPAAAPRRERRSFGELMDFLGGYPLFMRAILPSLNATESNTLLEQVRGDTSLRPEGDSGNSRIASLFAAIDSSFNCLSSATRTLLPPMSLFQGAVDMTALTYFSQASGVPVRFRGVSEQEWLDALEDAVRVGLLSRLSPGIYRLNPALPAYLAVQWRITEGEQYEAIRHASMRGLASAYALTAGSLEQLSGALDARAASEIRRMQRRTLSQLLGYALDHHMWEQALAIAPPVTQSHDERTDSWMNRMRDATEMGGSPPPLDSPAGALWLFAARGQAERYRLRNQLYEARQIYQQISTLLEGLPPSAWRDEQLSAVLQLISLLAEERSATAYRVIGENPFAS